MRERVARFPEALQQDFAAAVVSKRITDTKLRYWILPFVLCLAIVFSAWAQAVMLTNQFGFIEFGQLAVRVISSND